MLIVESGAFRLCFVGADVLRQIPVLATYDEIVGGARSFANGMDGTQSGNPDKAVAIDAAPKAEVTPLRLQLGCD